MPEIARRVRIAIADDHQIFRDGLRKLLESERGFEVVAEAADGIDAVSSSPSRGESHLSIRRMPSRAA